MALSAKDAAELVGMTKQGVIRAINKGKLSAAKNIHGQWEIEPVELFRVYQPVSTEVSTVDTNAINGDELLRQRLIALEDKLRDKDSQLADLRGERDAWQRQAAELASTNKLLTDKQVETRVSTPRQSWWRRLLG